MLPINIFPDTAKISGNGHLMIGGCDTVDLATEYGTPQYVFDEETLRRRCRSFTEEFSKRHHNSEVVYACKAYINQALAILFMEEGLGLDVVSEGEMAVARAVNFPAQKVYFHGNNKSGHELENALGWDIGCIVVDNFFELETLQALAKQVNKQQLIMLRVSPSIDPHTHAYTTTGVLDSKFGFAIETGQADIAIRMALNSPNIRLVGLHFHLGSPIFDVEPYKQAIYTVLRWASPFRDEGLNLQILSPGGGFAIAYTQDQSPPAVGDYAEAIVSTMLATCKAIDLEPPKLVIEPGRSIVGPAGVALYTSGSIKDIPGVRKYVSVDGGMGDNIRPALYGATYEPVVANRLDQEPDDIVTLAGKYCESGDVLVHDVKLPPVVPGDLIAIPATGAYCLSMASTYNLNGRPAVIMVKDGRSRLIRRHETYQDLAACDIL